MLVLAPVQYKKKLCSFEQLPSLYSICAAGIVFLKTSLSLSRALRLLQLQEFSQRNQTWELRAFTFAARLS